MVVITAVCLAGSRAVQMVSSKVDERVALRVLMRAATRAGRV